VFCIYLRTNSDLCYLQLKLIGFYNGDEKCLQRGTDLVFKYSCRRFVFKRLIQAVNFIWIVNKTSCCFKDRIFRLQSKYRPSSNLQPEMISTTLPKSSEYREGFMSFHMLFQNGRYVHFRPSVTMYQLGSQWTAFHEMLMLGTDMERDTRWRSWLWHCATSRKVAGSIIIESLIDIILPTSLWHFGRLTL
jgi:hypothetical protein